MVTAAFQLLDLLNGAVNRLEPMLREYWVPTAWEVELRKAEKELIELTPSELDTLVDGEEEEVRELVAAKGLNAVYKLLNGYFNSWGRDGGVEWII